MDKKIYMKGMLRAADFIEKNIKRKIGSEEAARAAFMSKDHFWRVFKAFFGETAGSYIRKRRLTVLAMKLASGSAPIEKLCFEYGYGSMETFFRGFKKQFGVTPAAYRKGAAADYSGFRKRISGGYARHMASARISMKPAYTVKKRAALYGIEGRVATDKSVAETAVFYLTFLVKRALRPSGKGRRYVVVSGADGERLTQAGRYINVFAGVERKAQAGRKDKKTALSPGVYAVFSHRGSIACMKYSCEYVFTRWAGSRRLRVNEVIAVFGNDNFLSDDFRMELWLRVK